MQQVLNLSLSVCSAEPQTKEYICELCSSLGSVVALLAFIFSVYTYKGQKKVNELQMMESTLFNMIELHLSIKNAMQFVGQQPTMSPLDDKCQFVDRKVSGCEVFKSFWEEYWFKDKYVDEGKHLKINLDYKKGKVGMINVLISLGSKAYQDYRELDVFNPYFTQLYEIIKFIDTRDFLNNKQKKEYVEQVRSILSSYELIWIYYDCLFGESNGKLKPLVEKYTFLKYIPKNSLATTRNIMTSKMFINNKMINDYQYYVTKIKGSKDKFYIGAFEDKQLKCNLVTRIVTL